MRGVVAIGASYASCAAEWTRGPCRPGSGRLERAPIIAPAETPKARLRGEKSLAFGPADDIRAEQRPQGCSCTDFVTSGGRCHRFSVAGPFRPPMVEAEVQPQRRAMRCHQVRATAVAVEAWQEVVGEVGVAEVDP